jgi:flagellar motor switch protein FliN
MALTRQAWFDRFAADLAAVVSALVDAPATASPAVEPPEGGWVVTLQGEQGVRGVLLVQFDRAAAEVLTKRVMGMEVEPPAEVVVDTLKEMCAQAAGSMVQEPPLVGARFVVASVEPATNQDAPAPVLLQIAVGEIATLRLRLWGALTLTTAAPPPEDAPATAAHNPRLDAILDIDLPLLVRFGRTEMLLRTLSALGPGSVIDLGRSPDDPVDLLVSNQVVARGEVVIVGGNYGVRITDVMSSGDRVRSIEGEL